MVVGSIQSLRTTHNNSNSVSADVRGAQEECREGDHSSHIRCREDPGVLEVQTG